jgi:divinyl protochlorophyllide a 8-vinyl-reductase
MQSGEAVPAGRIGPNAILRVMDALRAEQDAPVRGTVLERAGISGYLDAPPETMVDQGEVRALHSALREVLGIDGARRIGRDAGRRTGDYLLAHRIPGFAQRILRALPAPIAGRLLLKAITKNAWTFAGTARFTVAPGRVHRLTLAGCQVCEGASSETPLCDYYAAAFERLFQILVDPRSEVIETECQAQGHPACVFEISRKSS